MVRQHLTAPHSSVAAVAANDGGARPTDAKAPGRHHIRGDRGGVVQENISRGQMAGAASEVAAAKKALDDAVADVTDGRTRASTPTRTDRTTPHSPAGRAPGRTRAVQDPRALALVPMGRDARAGEAGRPRIFRRAIGDEDARGVRQDPRHHDEPVSRAKKAGERLSFTKARRGLVGDVNSLQRVFDFLERWGLINWQPKIDAEKAAGLGANVPRVVAVDVTRPEKPDPGTFSAANVALYR